MSDYPLTTVSNKKGAEAPANLRLLTLSVRCGGTALRCRLGL